MPEDDDGGDDDDDEENGGDDDTDVGGAELSGSIDDVCDTESDDLLVTGTATSVTPDLEVEDMGVALASVSGAEAEGETTLVELVRDGEVVDSEELPADGTVVLTDTLTLGDEATYELLIGGAVVDDAELVSDCVEVLAEIVEDEDEDEEDTEVAARIAATSDELPATGASALVLALLGLGAVGAGAGTLASTRRRA